MHARAPSGLLSGSGAHNWFARSTSHAPCRVRCQSIPEPIPTSSSLAARRTGRRPGSVQGSIPVLGVNPGIEAVNLMTVRVA